MVGAKSKGLSRGISVNVLLLGVVSFLNDASSEMIMPILPMLITSLGGAGLAIGSIGGVRDSLASILKVVCGHWSDRTGRKKAFVFSGYLTSSLFKLFLAFSRIWPHVLVFSGLERVGKGLRTAPRDAIIADSMPEKRGKGFGVHRSLDTSGAILGSVAVFLLFWFLAFGFKSIILTAAVVALLSLIPLYFVREKREEPCRVTLGIGLRRLPKSLRLFVLISGVFSLANFSYMFFILRAQEFFSAMGGASKLSIGVPILLYILFNIFYAAFAIPFGTLSDRIGRRKVILAGYLLFSLSSLGFALSHTAAAFVALFALYGVFHAIVDANQRAYVSDLSSPQLRATALGAFHTTVGLAALPASLIAGVLWENVGPSATFVYGSALGIVPVVLLLAFGRSLDADRP